MRVESGRFRMDGASLINNMTVISGNTTVAGTLSPGNSTGLLTFGGNLTYNGLLDLSFGFVPQVNSTFTLFDVAGTQSGDFADVVIRNAGFEGSFDADTGVFTLTAIPEPSTVLLLAMALVGGLHFRRRKLS